MAGPAAPAMATPDQRSAGNTFSMDRWLMKFPEVARRSPAITTPSAYRTATTVVPCGIAPAAETGPSGTEGLRPDERSSAAKSGPGSDEGENEGICIEGHVTGEPQGSGYS